MQREPACASCKEHHPWDDDNDPPRRLIFGRTGAALCSRCANSFLFIKLDEALPLAKTQENYSEEEIEAGEEEGFDQFACGEGVMARATHYYVRRDGKRIVAFRNEHQVDLPRDVLGVIFPPPPPDPLNRPLIARYENVTCSFCRRGRRASILVCHIARKGKRRALTYCLECMLVACEIFRRDGVFLDIPSRWGPPRG